MPRTTFVATPLGWAAHGSENGWDRRTGDYPAVVDALLQAGAEVPETATGTDAVKEVLPQARGQMMLLDRSAW